MKNDPLVVIGQKSGDHQSRWFSSYGRHEYVHKYNNIQWLLVDISASMNVVMLLAHKNNTGWKYVV